MKVLKHKYCCQNAAQRLLDHMYPVPRRFPVNPVLLDGMDEEGFLEGFHGLWRAVRALYEDMIVNPESYGLPLVEDIQYTTFNDKARESTNSAKRLMTLLRIMGRTGVMDGGGLRVDAKVYGDMIGAQKSKEKIANPNMILTRLAAFGFVIEGLDSPGFPRGLTSFTVTYPADPRVMGTLKAYSGIEDREFDFFSVHYDIAALPESLPQPAHAYVFSQYLTGNQHDFFVRFNELMLEAGFDCVPSLSYSYSVEYFDGGKKPYVARCMSEDNNLEVFLRTLNINKYEDFLDTLPSGVKDAYKAARPCTHCRACTSQRQFTLDGHTYELCRGESQGRIQVFNPEDAGLYVSLLKREAKRV